MIGPGTMPLYASEGTDGPAQAVPVRPKSFIVSPMVNCKVSSVDVDVDVAEILGAHICE